MPDTAPEKGFAPTYFQKGTFLVALGQEMLRRNLSAGAALDGHSNESIRHTMMAHGLDSETADKILALNHDELSEAIDGSI